MGIKYKVNESFFDTWNPVMAYILGYLYADGSLEDASYLRGKYIRVTSIDKKTIIKIRNWLSSKHTILNIKSPGYPHGNDRYFLRIGSHKLYDALILRGIYPNKSKTIRFPRIPKKYLPHFLRGYFDGDGCISLALAKGKKQKRIVKKLSVIFTSGSKKFLTDIVQTLNTHLALKHKNVYDTRRAFQLRYSTSDSIVWFKFLYRSVPNESYLPRKFKIFAKYFSRRPCKIDREIKKILQKHTA